MKTPLLLALALSASPFAFAVTPGDSAGDVRAVLGKPSGEMRVGERQLLYYANGSVELLNNRVTRVDLRTAEEQADIEAREERRRMEREARRADVVAEGTALRDRKLADAAFQSAPVAYQVAFWEDFARRYPGVPCDEPLTIARLKFDEQLEEKQRRDEDSRRIAELEARLADAERGPNYLVRHHYHGRGERRHEFSLLPVRYTYYDAPLPVYSTPTTPVIDGFRGVPIPSDRRDYNRDRDRDRDHNDHWNRDRRGDDRDRPNWRGADGHRGHRRDRM